MTTFWKNIRPGQCQPYMDTGRDEDAQGSGGKLLLRSRTVKTTENRKEIFQEHFPAQAWHFLSEIVYKSSGCKCAGCE